MAIMDFLFEGKPPAATTTYGSTTSTMPAWYNDYTQGLISKANAIAAAPYQAYTGARLATQTPDQTAAFDATRNLQPQFLQNMNPALNTIAGMQGANAPSSLTQFGGRPMNLYDEAAGINSMREAEGNLNLGQAATMASLNPATRNINQYMNPYQSSVVDEIGRLGGERLNDTMSGITDKFIGGGQFGSSRMGRSLGNAARAGSRDILGLQNQALQTGYGQALGASQADLARQLQAGSQFGSLGSTQANIAGQRQQNLANLGQSLGTFGQSDLQRQIDAAKTQGALGQTMNEVALRNAAAQQAIGDTQQQQAQRGLDLAYQDFTQQRDYPQQMISFLNNAIRGLQMPQSTQTTQTGVPAGSTSQASPLLQLASLGTAVGGLSQALRP